MWNDWPQAVGGTQCQSPGGRDDQAEVGSRSLGPSADGPWTPRRVGDEQLTWLVVTGT